MEETETESVKNNRTIQHTNAWLSVCPSVYFSRILLSSELFLLGEKLNDDKDVVYISVGCFIASTIGISIVILVSIIVIIVIVIIIILSRKI